MGTVLVVGDAPRGKLAPGSFEVASAGRALAGALGARLVGALVGRDLGPATEAFLTAGMAELYVADGARYEPFDGQEYTAAGEAILGACAPAVVLFPHTLNTREWAARLAARRRTGVVTDCVAVVVDQHQVVMTKPVYGGSVIAEYVVRGTPQMATMRAGAYEAATPGAVGQIVHVPGDVPSASSRVQVLEEVTESGPAGPRLKDAKVVVAGGLGVGGPEHWHLVEEAADALGGAVGASRAVTDLGWVPSAHQVGLTGTTVAPELYIAIGISGAVQHVAGIARAKTIVAINKDPDANILRMATFGAIGDARAIVPAFVERVRQLRG
jgi:electron transfer flavoprotein alpha subunit